MLARLVAVEADVDVVGVDVDADVDVDVHSKWATRAIGLVLGW